MESKVLRVFYGNDCLPYKDSNRSVHFPIVGNAFQGANNSTEIRFYYERIGGDDTTWVAVTKLPNGTTSPSRKAPGRSWSGRSVWRSRRRELRLPGSIS